MNNAPLKLFLYQTVGSSFTIMLYKDQASSPGMDQMELTSVFSLRATTSNVYQSTGNLHFSSFNVTTNGIYTCSSSLGATEIIMITNGI